MDALIMNNQPGLSQAQRQEVQRCIQELVHACQCRDANCSLCGCQKMKRLVHHTKMCQKKTNGGCPGCKQFIALCCYHARDCHEQECSVPFCHLIRIKLLQQALQRVQELEAQISPRQGLRGLG
ncbi:protein cbp-1-like [Branchiostoma lanceolatum]|uniref:protein cbp-1-like n=1 Tax=Branchiostoma lanceolatum TaxID=7740 RepID=UPI003454B8C6